MPDPSEQILLVDLSSIAYPVWHTSQSEPDANATSVKTVARVRDIAAAHKHVAICCDSGKSFRHEIDPQYKANRAEKDATLIHQINLAIEALSHDGFPIWSVKNYEADDIIATATARAMERPGCHVVIASADKDLLALVSDRVSVKSMNTGDLIDPAGVLAKFGVKPSQVPDYLCLVGDSSDNIIGAKNVGKVKAAELLKTFINLDILYQHIDDQAAKFTPALHASLVEFRPRMKTVRALVAMRTDVPLKFEEIFAERVPQEAVAAFAEEGEADDDEPIILDVPATHVPPQPEQNGAPTAVQAPSDPRPAATEIAVRESEASIAPVEWERQLDPRTPGQAKNLALDMFNSRMFSDYGSQQAVLSTILVGRELGLPAMASLRSIHNVKGRHALSADLMVALVLKSGVAEFFEPVEFDLEHATFITKRINGRAPISLTHTIKHAQLAGLVKDDSNWLKIPEEMLISRAKSRLARLVYADIISGLYTPEELAEMRG